MKRLILLYTWGILLLILVPIYGNTPTSNVHDHLDNMGGVIDLNAINFTQDLSGELTNLHSTNFNQKKVGEITFTNNSPAGYKITFKSLNSESADADGTTNANTSFLVLEGFDQDKGDAGTPANSKHRGVLGAFINYKLSVLPAGYSVNGNYSIANQTNDYGKDEPYENYHGCYATREVAIHPDPLVPNTTPPWDLLISNQDISIEDDMEFDLTSAPCIEREDGITATVDYTMDILLSTNAKKTLLSGKYSDTLEITITSLL